MPILVQWRTGASASALKERILHGQDQNGLYRLRSFVILNQEVKVLLEPKGTMRQILQRWEAAGARNRRIGLARAPRVVREIESDPVRAGLAQRPEQWQWSSAWTD